MEPIRVLFADDHALIRAGIRSILESIPGLDVVGEAGDGLQALELVATLHPHVLLTDIGMPHMNGLVVAERVAKEFPDVRVIILSMHTNEQFVAQAVRVGAAGYLLKDSDLGEFEFAINAVIRGETYLTPSISTQMMSSYAQLINGDVPLKTDPLTRRQREILRLVAQGITTKNIAMTLRISPKTVEAHLAQIMERLAIDNIPDLVRYAMRTGLVPSEKRGLPAEDS